MLPVSDTSYDSTAIYVDAERVISIGDRDSEWTFPLITKILIWTKISSQLERVSQN